MAKIKNKTYQHTIVLFAGLVSGFLLGAASLAALVSHRMDFYLQKIVQYEATIEEKDVKLRKLEESVNKKKYVLKDIEVVLGFEGHELDKIAIEKFIKEKYNSLLGKEINSIDTDMTAEIIDKIIVRIKEREYRLKTERLVLAEILKVWVKVDEIK